MKALSKKTFTEIPQYDEYGYRINKGRDYKDYFLPHEWRRMRKNDPHNLKERRKSI